MFLKCLQVLLLVLSVSGDMRAIAGINRNDAEFAYVLLHSDMDYGERSVHKFESFSQEEKDRLRPLFCEGINNPDLKVRERAVNLLSVVGNSALPCLVEALKNKSVKAFTVLWALPKNGPLPKDVEREVIKLLEDPDRNIQREAITALGNSQNYSQDAANAIKRKLASKDNVLRPYIVCSLGLMGDLQDSLPMLRQAIRDGDEGAIVCAGKIGPKASPLVPDIIARGKEKISDSIIISLGKIGKDAAPGLPLLVKVLKKGQENIGTAYAVDAIINIGIATDDVVEVMDRLLPFYRFRWPKPTFSNFGPKDSRKLFPKIVELISSSQDSSFKVDVVPALSDMAPQLKGELLSLFKTTSPVDSTMFAAVAKCGPEAAKPIASYLSDENNGVRLDAVNALKTMGPEAADAIPELLKFINTRYDNDLNAGYYAYETMGVIGEKAFPNLRAALDSPKPQSWPIVSLGAMVPNKEINKMLISLLNNSDPVVREEAVHSLQRLHNSPMETVPALIKTLEDTNGRVSAAAVRALEPFGVDAKSAIPSLKKQLNAALQGNEPWRTYLLLKVLGSLEASSDKVDELLISALLNFKVRSSPENVRAEIFEKITILPGKYKQKLLSFVKLPSEPEMPAWSSERELTAILGVLSKSRLIEVQELVDMMSGDKVTLANAAFATVCEVGTVEARDACEKFARSPKNPRRFSK